MKFGTDGVRGVANTELTPQFVLGLGRALAEVVEGQRFLVARDPRRSGTMIEAALAAGLAAGGVDVDLVGVMPTPALAQLAAHEHVPAAMISASHNPASDNGVKVFAAGGLKLSDDAEGAVEAALEALADGGDGPTGAGVGQIFSRPNETAAYERAMVASVPGFVAPNDLRVVIDCANGAASAVAPRVFAQLGVDTVVLHAEPDGLNINDRCGSTYLDALAHAVATHQADLGFAFDGDADRVLAVSGAGDHVDGDQLMALLAIDRNERGLLADNTVVVTVMTNLGFRLAMTGRGINVVETAVGDRYVLEALAAGSYSLGGEQSGHIILPELATTGDGLLTAVQVLSLIARSGTGLGALAEDAMQRLPQVLESVAVQGDAAPVLARLASVIDDVEIALGANGRVLVRASGTEPVIRVMAEALEPAAAQDAVDRIVAAISP